MAEQKDHPKVITRPPYLIFGPLALGWILGRYFPLPVDFQESTQTYGVYIVAGSAAWVAWCLWTMHKARTGIDPYSPTTAIVKVGPFGVSRNPIYLGLLLFYLGFSFRHALSWSLLFFPLVWAAIRYGVIAREEIYLETKFGDTYRQYCKEVRRWI